MKLKESNSNIKNSVLLPVFAVTAILGIIIRAVQMRFFIDAQTGFFTGGTALNILFYLLLVSTFIVFCAVSYISKDSAEIDAVGIHDKKLAAVSIVFAVFMLFDSFSQLINAFSFFDSISYQQLFLFKALMASGTLPALLQSLFAVISAVYFTVAAISFKKGNGSISNHKYIALAPVFWAGFKLIARFIKQISYVQVSDLLLELMMVAMMIVFFMAFAQTASGVYSEDTRWRVIGFGLSSALVAVVIGVPRFIFTFINSGVYLNDEYPFYSVDFVYAVFVVVLCICLIEKKNNNNSENSSDT